MVHSTSGELQGNEYLIPEGVLGFRGTAKQFRAVEREAERVYGADSAFPKGPRLYNGQGLMIVLVRASRAAIALAKSGEYGIGGLEILPPGTPIRIAQP